MAVTMCVFGLESFSLTLQVLGRYAFYSLTVKV